MSQNLQPLLDPDALVRVRYREKENFVGPLWGLFFQENNLSEPIYRSFAQLAVSRSGEEDAYRILEIVEIDQTTFEPLAEQPTHEEALQRQRPQVIDLGLRREEIERRKPPEPDRGVPTVAELIEREAKQREINRLPTALPPIGFSEPAPLPPPPALASVLLDDDDAPPLAPTTEIKSEVVGDLVRNLAVPPPVPPKPAPVSPPPEEKRRKTNKV